MKLPPGHVPGLSVQHKATAYGGFGQKMLEKMGWEKGQGLGKEKHGMKSAIEVKKKEDTLGVGATTTGWKWDWKYWEDAYNTGLQSLSKDSKKKKRRNKSSSGSSSDSDSDDSTSTSTTTSSSSSDSGSDDSSSASDSGSEASSSDSDSESDMEHNARLAAAIGPVLNRDGTKASASKAEMKIAKQLAKVERGSAGRFGGRAGKMARIRQQEAEQAAAMAAKLGIPASPAVTAGSQGAAASGSSEDTAAAVAAPDSSKKSKKRKQADSSGDEDASAAASRGNKKQKQNKKDLQSKQNISEQQHKVEEDGQPAAAKKQRVIVVVDIKGRSTAESFKQFKPTPATGWWGAKMFASAGLLEGLEKEQEQRKRTTFDEDMQAKVYMAAHDAQRQGKRGLGKRAIKIAGGNWEGKKVTFDEEAPSEQHEQQQAAQQQDGPAADNAAVSRSKKKLKPSSNVHHSASSKGQQCSNKLDKKVKWTKLAVGQLKDCAGGVLKWKKLWPLLKAGAEQQGAEVPEGSKERAWQKLQACRQIEINGKLVCLAA